MIGKLAQVWEKLASLVKAAAYHLPTPLRQGRKGGQGNTAQLLFLDPAH